jgi:methionyl-tRNA formyltransferase
MNITKQIMKLNLTSLSSLLSSKRINIRYYSHSIIRNKKKIIFLGTPAVAANSLEILINDFNSSLLNEYEIIAVVTQPPAPSGRKKKILSSPVQLIAEKYNIPIYTPKKANEKSFLTSFEELKPDLCITAAYGNYLPTRFLKIPIYGTLNIHPSLLPKYRGAAPIQRCLEQGDDNIGVSLLFTVQSMDAGPIAKQTIHPLNGNEKAPEIMMELFAAGTNELLKILPSIFDGSIKDQLIQQDESKATSADKLSPLDSQINFSTNTAIEIHNKVNIIIIMYYVILLYI